jgi:DNA polymerase III epsilon subunit-like protein
MKALIFDTEATQLVTNSLVKEQHQPRIIEFFGQIVDDEGTIHEELEFMCNPGISIPEKVTEITGIKDEDVAGAQPFATFAGQVKEIIERADAVVAHNLSYDWFVVNQEMDRNGVKVDWPKIRICTVEETEWIKGFRLNLSALHEHLFDEPFSGAHRAREDVGALTRCYLELRRLEEI